MKKRGISLFVALIMLFTFSISAFAATFKDVSNDFWAKKEIEELSAAGVISGYTDGTFKPNANITKEEAVALFAKALGYNESVNKEIIALAVEINAPLLENYNSYAVDQAAYLIYKNVLAEEDIVNFMTTANKSQPLKRYEAAVMIAKALGADSWLLTKPDFNLTYKDSAKIPDYARAYVYYAGEKGIMKGMDQDNFGPDGNVTRAQVAVMIHRILTTMQFSYAAGIVAKVDATFNNVTMKTLEGDTLSYNVSKEIPVRINGELSQITLLEPGLEVVLTKSGNSLFAIDAIKVIPDEAIIGVFKGKLTETKSTTIKIANMESGVITSYKMAQNAAVTYNGTASTLSAFQSGDYVKAEIKNGEIAIIDGEPKNVKIEDLIVEAIEFTPDVTLKLRRKDNEVLSYPVKSNATLKRNNKTVEFSELAIGDDVDITLEYGVIDSVYAIGMDKNVTGIVEEITISKNTSYITVNNGTQNVKYALSRDVQIEIDNEEASIYDLRLGAQVKFSASSSTITKLVVESATVSSQVTGTVTLVNGTYGMIVVSATNNAGDIVEEQIFVKSTAKILDAGDGRVKTVKDLKVGQQIMAAVTENTGILEATSIMILAQ